MDLSQEDPIPLLDEGQTLLTQNVLIGDGVTDSSLRAIKCTHMETLRAILRAKGHSREAAHMMSRSLRDSSLQVYECHRTRFVSFCGSKRWQVFRVRSHNFCNYMMHLFRDVLLPATIISLRTSVASVLRHGVNDPVADPRIKLLIRTFRLEHLVQCRLMPKWDLHLVLSSLLKPPFASMCDIQGECHSLQMCVRKREHPTSTPGISFGGTCVPCEESTTITGSPEWISIPGIAHLNPFEAERMLWPVRQLKLHLRD